MTVAGETDGEGGRPGTGMNGPRRRPADDPAGRGGGRTDFGLRTQEQSRPPFVRRGERKPAARHAIDGVGFAHLAQNRADGATAQPLLHRPQHVARVRGPYQHERLGRKSDRIEAGSVRRAALRLRHRLGDPQDRACRHAVRRSRTGIRSRGKAGRKRQRKAGRSRNLRLARRNDLVQGSAGQAPAQRRIDRRNVEGEPHRRIVQCLGPPFERAHRAPQSVRDTPRRRIPERDRRIA